MQVTTEPVLIVGYGKWSDVVGDKVERKDGTPVEYADILDLGASEPTPLRWTIDESLNGDRPGAMTTVPITAELRYDAEKRKLKGRVLAFGKPVAK
ncbi:MAG: hypothetical protein ACRDU4_22180 [Mycobacterium sp.]